MDCYRVSNVVVNCLAYSICYPTFMPYPKTGPLTSCELIQDSNCCVLTLIQVSSLESSLHMGLVQGQAV